MKPCSRCRQLKPLSEYHKHGTGEGRLRPDCKTCCRQLSRESRARKRAGQPNRQKGKHVLSNLRPDERRADCRHCGPNVRTMPASNGSGWVGQRCYEGHLERRRRDYGRGYGLTEEQYREVIDSANGVCMICEDKHPGPFELVLDHNHETGMARGALCSSCNIGLGCFRDSVIILNSAIRYLEER